MGDGSTVGTMAGFGDGAGFAGGSGADVADGSGAGGSAEGAGDF